jgi:Protein of unknown function (DUF1295)
MLRPPPAQPPPGGASNRSVRQQLPPRQHSLRLPRHSRPASRSLRGGPRTVSQPQPPPTSAPAPLALSSQSLLGIFSFDLAAQWLGWAFASALKTEKFYDLFGSLTFIASGVGGHLGGTAAAVPRARVATALLCVWATRLGTHLVRRITRDGHDKRFDGVRDNPKRFLVFWTIQGLWVFITSLPVTLLNLTPQQRSLGLWDALGA